MQAFHAMPGEYRSSTHYIGALKERFILRDLLVQLSMTNSYIKYIYQSLKGAFAVTNVARDIKLTISEGYSINPPINVIQSPGNLETEILYLEDALTYF